MTGDVLDDIEEFSLLGGPLQRSLGRWRDRHAALGFLLAASLWTVLVAIAIGEGHASRVLSFSVIGGHVRVLVVIPLLFLCEGALDPQIRAFLRELVRSAVVPASEVPALRAALLRVRRGKESSLPDVVCFATALSLLPFGQYLHLSGSTANYDPLHLPMSATWTSNWYWFVCLTIYRFVLFRWVWRVALWWYLLRRIATLPLRLVAAHPDRMGGLGNLQLVQIHLLPLVSAVSVVQSASLAEDLARARIPFEATFPTVLLTLGVSAILMLSPLLFFLKQSWACRVDGWSAYAELATHYVRQFDEKWVRAEPAEPLLGTPDLQSLADLGTSFQVVHEMQWVPISLTLLKEMSLATVTPFVPLILLRYPLSAVAERFFKILF
ncbi:MAG TPA: hypothetical protein VI299_01730 [Polyangiales bacterium]